MDPTFHRKLAPPRLPGILAGSVLGTLAFGLSSGIAATADEADQPPKSSEESAAIKIVAGTHPDDGKLDELHILCIDGKDKVDLALPKRWVAFLIKHSKSEIDIDGDDLDLGLLWETIEDLRPGEEILIKDGASAVRLWLE